MKTLEQIKSELAIEEGYGDWKEDMLAGAKELCTLNHLDRLVNKVAERFAYELAISEQKKLRALLEGLKTEHIDKLLSEGKTGDFRAYGHVYFNAVKDKINSVLQEAKTKIDMSQIGENDKWDEGFNTGIERAKEILQSLQIKN